MHPGGTLITRGDTGVCWWTRAGYRLKATLAATLLSVTDPVQRPTDLSVWLWEDVIARTWAWGREGAFGARSYGGVGLVLFLAFAKVGQGPFDSLHELVQVTEALLGHGAALIGRGSIVLLRHPPHIE